MFSKYLQLNIGIYSFIGGIFALYYDIYWAGLALLLVSIIILVPEVFRFIKKRVRNSQEAGCLIFLITFVPLLVFGTYKLFKALTPNINKGLIMVSTAEMQINDATKPCFTSFDNVFSQSAQNRNNQCAMVTNSMTTCASAITKVNNIVLSPEINKDATVLLVESKNLAASALQSWVNIYSMYNKQCNGDETPPDANKMKLDLIEAKKNEYFMSLKIKKAKSVSGL